MSGLRPARRIGAYGVLRDDAGRVLLTRSSELSDVPGTWYLPGGGVEHGEDPADTVVREVAEETGLDVEVAGLRSVVSDVVELPARGQRLHTDRILYDLRQRGGRMRPEPSGTTDLASWVPMGQAAELPLMPFVAAALGLPASQPWVRGDLPPGEVVTEPAARPATRQRFAAYGVVHDPAGRLLLTLISDGYPGAGRWHLPGGGVDHGEDPAAGLRRELSEEADQRGGAPELLAVASRRDRSALGPEGYPIDWHGVRVLYRVLVADPAEPRVLDVGGSTARAAWFAPDEVPTVPVTDTVEWALAVAGVRPH